MDSEERSVRTGDRLVTDLTADAESFCRGKGDGLLNVFAPHATAGVGLMELGSGSEADLAGAIDRVVPRSASYQHRHGSAGHGADHVLPLFVAPSLTIPVVEGRLALGTWQSVVLVDPNVDNPDRRVRFSFVSGG